MKIKTQTAQLPESMALYLIELERRGAVISPRSLVIRKDEWPFVVRVIMDADTRELVLRAGYRTENQVRIHSHILARGETAVCAEIERLMALNSDQLEAIGDATLAAVFSAFNPAIKQ